MNAHGRLQSHSGQSSSFEKKRRLRLIVWWTLGILGIVSWVVIASQFTKASLFSITTVNAYSPSKDLLPGIERAAYTSLSGSYLGLFAKSNTLIYPKHSIISAVVASSPRIGAVQVKRDGLHALNISVSEKSSGAIVCPDLPSFDDKGVLTRDSKCYFADETGLIFEKVPESFTGTYNRYYAPGLPDDGTIIGYHATSTAKFKILQAMIDVIRTAEIVPEALLIKEGGEYELYVDNPAVFGKTATSTTGTVVVYMSDAKSLSVELDNFILFWKAMVDKAKTSKTHIEWSEIKLQYPPNVYYTEVKS